MDSVGAHWFWFSLAALLAALEFAVPSKAVIWMACAAVFTGAIAWLTPLGPAVESIVFAFLALVAAFAGRVHLRSRTGKPVNTDNSVKRHRWGKACGDAAAALEDDPLHLVGKKARVSSEIVSGEGRVFIAGSEWIAHGPDTHAGALVTIVGRQDAVLLVE